MSRPAATRRLRELDHAAFREVATTSHTPAGDRLLRGVSRAGDWSVIWVVTALLLSVLGGRRGRRAALRGWLAIAVSSGVFNHSIKLLVRRARPDLELVPSDRHPVKSTSTFSFPSGHTASAFAFTTGIAPEFPRLAAGLHTVAVAMGYSRVHAGMHYPSDVIAGAAAGTAAGLVSRPLWRRLSALGGTPSGPPDGRSAGLT